jgi:DNA-binding NtrC family response regulator
VSTTLRSQLVALARDMVERGIHYDDARKELERAFVVTALEQADGSIQEAAARIGMHRNTFSRKLTEHHLAPSRR